MQGGAELIGSLLGGALGLIAVVGLLTAIGLYCWIPFNVWRLARNAAKIAAQLQRVADALEHANRGGRDEVRELELARRTRS